MITPLDLYPMIRFTSSVHTSLPLGIATKGSSTHGIAPMDLPCGIDQHGSHYLKSSAAATADVVKIQ